MSRRRAASGPTINSELRRLQKAQALLIALQFAANEKVEFDIGDALLVVIGLLPESLQGLDRDVPNKTLSPDKPSLGAVNATSRNYFRAFGRRIAMLRKQRELTQAELGHLLGLSQQTIVAYEAGSRRVQLPQLAMLLKLSAFRLRRC